MKDDLELIKALFDLATAAIHFFKEVQGFPVDPGTVALILSIATLLLFWISRPSQRNPR